MIQESSRLDCQRFGDYSNQKQTEYESGLKKLKMSESLYQARLMEIWGVWGARLEVWRLLGYEGMANTCSESKERDLFRIPRLLVDPSPLSFPSSVEGGISYFKEKGFVIFVPNVWEAYLVEARIDQSHDLIQRLQRRRPAEAQAFLQSLVTALGAYSGFLRNLDGVYSTFKSSHCGTEIASNNQVFYFFSYVEKRINLLISKVELIQEQGKIAGSLSEDIFRQELRNSVLELINVINLKVQDTK